MPPFSFISVAASSTPLRTDSPIVTTPSPESGAMKPILIGPVPFGLGFRARTMRTTTTIAIIILRVLDILVCKDCFTILYHFYCRLRDKFPLWTYSQFAQGTLKSF